MNWVRFILAELVVFATLLSLTSSAVWSQTSQRVLGTLLEMPSASSISVETASGRKSYTVSSGTAIKRGQVGLTAKPAKLVDLRPGDYLTINVKSNGTASELSASFGIVKGKLASSSDNSLLFVDGRKVAARKGAQVILPDGGVGSLDRLTPGAELTCRINPSNNEAWTVVAHSLSDTPTASASAAPKSPAPRITALTYEPASGLSPGSKITVSMTATPGGKASFDVRGLLGVTLLKEVSSGSYVAEVRLPIGKAAVSAPLVGYLTVGNSKAPAVQASRLLSVTDAAPTVAPPPAASAVSVRPQATVVEVSPKVASEPVAQPVRPSTAVVPVDSVPVKTPAPEAPRDLPNIVIRTPENNSRIRSAIVVAGQASPDAKVAVVVTYNNGLSGLLKLAGQVTSQTLAAGKDGAFKLGPIALDGPLATKGLRFTIKAYYPEKANHGTAIVTAIGDRL